MHATFDYIEKDGSRGTHTMTWAGGYHGWLLAQVDLLCSRFGWCRTSPITLSREGIDR